ncbi:MAG: hypothetical protein JNK41_12050 [Saprospiraceae bacterium]|jgi:vacuolar-type H+-ATPase subunit D/Vma8|nr:hypothetical protein [Saprospiraceae bacterium]
MKDSMAHVHLMCEDWKRELLYFKSEIPFFRKKLEEVASKNTAQEVMIQVEHFENKFRIMSENLDEVLHDVNLKNQSILDRAAEQPKYINVKMIEGFEVIHEEMESTARDFYDTKKEYYHFLADVL